MDPSVAILVALVALIGVLVAAILQARSVNDTIKQNGLIEVERWNREDRRRHEDARRAAYPAFLAVVDEGVLGINGLLSAGGSISEPFAGPHWNERLRESLAVIEFVGTPPTIDGAQRLYRAVRRLLVGAEGLLTATCAADPEVGDAEEAADPEVGDAEEAADPEVGDAEEAADPARRMGTAGLMDFLKTLPYPLGDDVAPHEMYGGNHWVQVSMARAELRVRRHEFVNAARTDLGMDEIRYPDDGGGWTPDEDLADEAPG
jgi:hypothetical protein